MGIIKKSGFTIVELLIVIVIIAILASISIVVYSGMRQRADESAVISTVRSIAGAFEAYGAITGALPQADWACVGELEDYPAANGYAAGWCSKPDQPEPIPGGDIHPISSTVNTKLRTVVNRVPNGTIPEINYPGGYNIKGVMYDSSNGFSSYPILNFYVKGYSATTCPIGIRITGSPIMNYTRCMYVFEGFGVET